MGGYVGGWVEERGVGGVLEEREMGLGVWGGWGVGVG